MDFEAGIFSGPFTAAGLQIFVEGEGGTTFLARPARQPQFFMAGPVRLGAYGQE